MTAKRRRSKPKPRSGATIPESIRRERGQVLLAVRVPSWLVELADAAAESSSCTRPEWLRSSLILQAADELGLDPVAALNGERRPAK